jgi:hypothetical protein
MADSSKYAYLTGGDGDLRVHEPDGARGDVGAEHGGRVVVGTPMRSVPSPAYKLSTVRLCTHA